LGHGLIEFDVFEEFDPDKKYHNSSSIIVPELPGTNEVKVCKPLFSKKIIYHWPNHKISVDAE
jgi:hypothetical protein